MVVLYKHKDSGSLYYLDLQTNKAMCVLCVTDAHQWRRITSRIDLGSEKESVARQTKTLLDIQSLLAVKALVDASS